MQTERNGREFFSTREELQRSSLTLRTLRGRFVLRAWWRCPCLCHQGAVSRSAKSPRAVLQAESQTKYVARTRTNRQSVRTWRLLVGSVEAALPQKRKATPLMAGHSSAPPLALMNPTKESTAADPRRPNRERILDGGLWRTNLLAFTTSPCFAQSIPLATLRACYFPRNFRLVPLVRIIYGPPDVLSTTGGKKKHRVTPHSYSSKRIGRGRYDGQYKTCLCITAADASRPCRSS
jgi:hypothetical protein